MVRASGIRGYATLMRSLGAAPLPLLRRCRIAPAALDDDDALLSLQSVVQLLEASAGQTGCGDFGLRLAQYQDADALNPLGIVLQNAATVREAMALASRYMFVHSPGLAFTAYGDSTLFKDAVEWAVELRLPGVQRQAIDLTLGGAHRITQINAGRDYRLEGVTLPHAPLVPIGHYRRFFGAPVRGSRERAALHIGRATLDAGRAQANPALRQITEDYLQRNFRDPDQSLGARVQLAVRRTLAAQRCEKTDVAGLLAMHPRTLQRRLEAEGTSFSAIKDAVRQDLARRYLRDTRIPLTQVAGLLGLPEQSALTRSCRRWFGAAPSAMRREAG